MVIANCVIRTYSSKSKTLWKVNLKIASCTYLKALQRPQTSFHIIETGWLLTQMSSRIERNQKRVCLLISKKLLREDLLSSSNTFQCQSWPWCSVSYHVKVTTGQPFTPTTTWGSMGNIPRRTFCPKPGMRNNDYILSDVIQIAKFVRKSVEVFEIKFNFSMSLALGKFLTFWRIIVQSLQTVPGTMSYPPRPHGARGWGGGGWEVTGTRDILSFQAASGKHSYFPQVLNQIDRSTTDY